MLSGQKTFSGVAALSLTTAMLALSISYNAPSAAAKSVETYIYFAEVHYFLPAGDVQLPACGPSRDVQAVHCTRFDSPVIR